MKNLSLVAILVLLAPLFIPGISPAGASCVKENEFFTTNSSVRVSIPSNVPTFVKQAIRQGMGEWNSSNCNATGFDFPKFVESDPTEAALEFHYVRSGLGPISPSSGATVCGLIDGGSIRARIWLYEFFKTSDGVTVRCPDTAISLRDLVAHEMGHYLGLGESRCANFIMGPMPVDIYDGAATHYPTRKIQAEECSKADELNFTKRELCSVVGCGSSGQGPLQDDPGDGSGTQSGGGGGGCHWHCVNLGYALACDLKC